MQSVTIFLKDSFLHLLRIDSLSNGIEKLYVGFSTRTEQNGLVSKFANGLPTWLKSLIWNRKNLINLNDNGALELKQQMLTMHIIHACLLLYLKLLYLVSDLTSWKSSHAERGRSDFKPHKSYTETLPTIAESTQAQAIRNWKSSDFCQSLRWIFYSKSEFSLLRTYHSYRIYKRCENQIWTLNIHSCGIEPVCGIENLNGINASEFLASLFFAIFF